MERINPSSFFQWQKDSRRLSHLFIAIFFCRSLVWSFLLYQTTHFLLKNALALPPEAAKMAAIYGPYFTGGPRNGDDFKLASFVAVFSFAALTIGISFHRTPQVKTNGSAFVTSAMGAIPLAPTESVLDAEAGKRRETILRNVVAEMRLAAAMPEPDVYILPKEEGINAMAVGLSEDDCGVALTKGALRRLDRDELSDVVGHELSHIINGDMRHNTLMSAWLHGFFYLTSL
jgi:Zn-dependent protease with chaperone function